MRYVLIQSTPRGPQEGGSPQRPWLEESLRAYYRSARSRDAAINDLRMRVSRSQSERRFANGAAVASMLECFIKLDDREPTPEAYFPFAATRGQLGKHAIQLKPSLRYQLADGYLVRHVWSERDFALSRPYTPLVAAGYLIHSEANLGEGSVRQVEFWHVRTGKVAGWRARSLRLLVPNLEAVLDRVAAELGQSR